MKKQAKIFGVLLSAVIATGGAGYSFPQDNNSALAAELPKREMNAPIVKETQGIKNSVPVKSKIEQPAAPKVNQNDTATKPSISPLNHSNIVTQTNSAPRAENATQSKRVPQFENNAHPKPAPQAENAAPTEQKQKEDFIIIDGSKFELVTEKKFSIWINAVKKHGAKLYGINESDVFAVVKDGTQVAALSTGYASTSVQNKELLIDLMANQGKVSGAIAEGIRSVASTGNPVNVPGESEFESYSIYIAENGALTISW
ncbi:hypothetical protein [Bacillus massilinigeriensis]|uniref:hypothetical protein n=1 Tax=Bacillus mediterraneensis TaxID=1805474 RepID=UPI0008F7E8BC|nr:hypothetical protein [Bacillus mediterraneensis]